MLTAHQMKSQLNTRKFQMREYMKQCGPLKVFSGLGYEIHICTYIAETTSTWTGSLALQHSATLAL